MSINIFLIYFFSTLVLSAIATVVVRLLSRKIGVLDYPGERKIHSKPIPLLGGLAIFGSFFFFMAFSGPHLLSGVLTYRHWLGFFFGALILMIGGFLDDKYRLAPRWQIMFPFLATGALILGGVEMPKISNPFGGYIYFDIFPALSSVLVILWMMGMMYTTKLLDGVDGLVTGLGAIGAIVIFLFTASTQYFQPDIAWAAGLFCAACLGFLIFNFNRASIFLGEGGSLLIGYVLGALAIISGGKIAVALLIMGLPILDVFWTIIRRVASGKNPFRFADKQHLHHRLLSAGFSQRQTVLFFYFFALIFGLSALFLQSKGKFLALGVLLLVMFSIVIILSRVKYKPRLLLHVCCAPCAAYGTIHRLRKDFRVSWYFFNPNLLSPEEYQKRFEVAERFASRHRIPLFFETYNHASWLDFVAGREDDPERGERCQLCYRQRLEQTAQLAKEKKFTYFSTSLLTSPYKDTKAINRIGEELGKKHGVAYLAVDLQEDNGYRLSQEFAKSQNFYRQKFCGCEFSWSNAKKFLIFAFIVFGFCFSRAVYAEENLAASTTNTIVQDASSIDSDNDGLNDQDEIRYLTDPNNSDTDSDGFKDWQEINRGYSPLKTNARLEQIDTDKDGLNDYLEIKFGTKLDNPDTDSDGFKDGQEVDFGYDPLKAGKESRLKQQIKIDLKKQRLNYFVGAQKWKEFIISSGKKSTPTPKGNFKIINKSLKAWSKAYGLYMPYWQGLSRGEFGLHALPVWPNGYQEGKNHLGKPVSHGCIRLDNDGAKYLYDRLPLGTEVIIE